MLIKKGSLDFNNNGRQYLVSIKVPLVFTLHIKSNFFIEIFMVLPKSIAEALLTITSILPNFSLITFIAFFTSYSFLKSHEIGKTIPFPPIY